MSRDYQGPYYSLDDLRSVIDAMCKSIESSGLIDEREHPSAYSALLDTSKWMAEMEGQEPVQYETRTRPDWRGEWYPWERCSKEQADDYRKTPRLHDWHYEVRELYARPVPAERPVNARLLDVATGKIPHLYEGRCPDYVNGPESRDPDCPACQAIVSADAQQERLLQDMHDAGREIDRVMAEPEQKEPVAGPVNAQLLAALKVCRHKFAQYVAHHISKGDMHKAMANESMVAMADVAIMGAEAAPRVARLTRPDIAKAKAEEREACLRCYSPDDTATDWADKIRTRGHG